MAMYKKGIYHLGHSNHPCVRRLRKKVKFNDISTTSLIIFVTLIRLERLFPVLRDAARLDTSLIPRKEAFDYASIFSCGAAYPHVDEGIVGDFTLGVVLEGAHVLYQGATKRNKINLGTGDVFLLNNKKVHGADCLNKPYTPLVFATYDMCFESMDQAIQTLGVVI